MKTVKRSWLAQLGVVLCILFVLDACKHEPTFQPMDPPGGGDTNMTDPGDTGMVDPGDTSIIDVNDTLPLGGTQACDPDTVYFDKDIMPILKVECARSGCHDMESRDGGVVLSSYGQLVLTTKLVAFSPEESEIYTIITDDDPDNIMPPPPNNDPLKSDEIALIRKWIEQGAKYLVCDESIVCDTVDVSYAAKVQPILQTHCVGCHGDNNPGGGISLNSHNAVLGSANSGQLVGSIFHEPGFVAMPRGASKLPDCEINTIKAWVDQGAKDN